MEEQYGIVNLAHYMNGSPIFTAIPQPPRDPRDHHYEMMVVGSGGGGGRTIAPDSTPSAGLRIAGLNVGDGDSEMGIGGDDVNGRWPSQETQALLEVRSRLNSNFKEANHKGPLWNEVSRIMSEEHGYQRNGKKCREKFENLYKYYKRTKEGKAGRQDGKHYRFFSQLEALYDESGRSTCPNPNLNQACRISGNSKLNVVRSSYHPRLHSGDICQEAPQTTPSRLCGNLSLSNNSSAYDTFSPDHRNPCVAMGSFTENTDYGGKMINKRRLRKRSWKKKIKDFIDAQMRKIMDKQEAWMEKIMKTIEQKEQERISRLEQWRKEDMDRLESKHKFWGQQRAWMESREPVLMLALHKLTMKESLHNNSFPECNDYTNNPMCWGENEINQLIHFRTNMGTRFDHGGNMEEVLWDEIASKMACLGYNRKASICKTKWDGINEFLERSRKRKESMRSSNVQYQVGTLHEDERSVEPSDHQNDVCYADF